MGSSLAPVPSFRFQALEENHAPPARSVQKAPRSVTGVPRSAPSHGRGALSLLSPACVRLGSLLGRAPRPAGSRALDPGSGLAPQGRA